MNLKCIQNLQAALMDAFPGAVLPENWQIAVEQCPPGMEGDITINCFRFVKLFKNAPDKVADKVCELLAADPDVKKAEKVKAFVNVTLNAAALFRDTVGNVPAIMQEGILPEKDQRRILIEYSAPNTNKPQHLGHVRNNTLGMSTCKLLSRVGHDVIPVNLINDRGIHICKSMLAYQRFGNGDTPEKAGIKGDHFVGNYYVRYNDELKKQITALRAEKPELADKDDDELFLMTEIGEAAQAMLRKWENSDPETVALWKLMNS